MEEKEEEGSMRGSVWVVGWKGLCAGSVRVVGLFAGAWLCDFWGRFKSAEPDWTCLFKNQQKKSMVMWSTEKNRFPKFLSDQSFVVKKSSVALFKIKRGVVRSYCPESSVTLTCSAGLPFPR